jgi:hypothetical protein
MTRFIELICEDIVAKAELLDDKAPNTCNLVWGILPLQGYLTHAVYSGAEVAMVLPDYYPLESENATTAVLPWEIFFASLLAKDFFDVDNDFSEFAFFYDRNTGPRMLDGLVKVNIFARFITCQEEFKQICLQIRRGEGKKAITIRHAS